MPEVLNFDETAEREKSRRDGITHISTGVAVVKDGGILMVRRASGDFLGGQFELPGGGVDEGETITEGAARELAEETNLKVKRILGIFDGFDYATDRKPRVRQFNFLVEVEEPYDIYLDPNEHDEYTMATDKNISEIPMDIEMLQCVQRALDLARTLGVIK